MGPSVTPPLVTCICPTASRRDFLRAAIGHFSAQDYPAKRLVIVEDGRESNVDLLDVVPPGVPVEFLNQITYVYLDGPRRTIGEKRNRACEIAGAGLIAHWDDDDWHHPRRLSIQIAAMRAAGARLCGMDRLVFYDGAQAWLYRSDDPNFLAGGSLIYERALWRDQPFEHRSNGEDTLFVRAALGRDVKIAKVANEKLYVARVHAGNTAPKNTADRQWGGFDVQRVRRWIDEKEAV